MAVKPSRCVDVKHTLLTSVRDDPKMLKVAFFCLFPRVGREETVEQEVKEEKQHVEEVTHVLIVITTLKPLIE